MRENTKRLVSPAANRTVPGGANAHAYDTIYDSAIVNVNKRI